MLPSSRASFRFRLSPIDVIWAALAPLLALYLRDALVLSVQGAPIAFLYCGLSFVCTLIAFLAFRVSAGISRYFSVHDAVSVVSAVIAAGLTTTLILFTLTRLEGIPRSIPVMQGLVLAAGLLLTRGVMRLWDKDDQQFEPVRPFRSRAHHHDRLLASHLALHQTAVGPRTGAAPRHRRP